jgi:hypothetical protein
MPVSYGDDGNALGENTSGYYGDRLRKRPVFFYPFCVRNK